MVSTFHLGTVARMLKFFLLLTVACCFGAKLSSKEMIASEELESGRFLEVIGSNVRFSVQNCLLFQGLLEAFVQHFFDGDFEKVEGKVTVNYDHS